MLKIRSNQLVSGEFYKGIKVFKIIDGDTLLIDPRILLDITNPNQKEYKSNSNGEHKIYKIRLLGIDAPEKGQNEVDSLIVNQIANILKEENFKISYKHNSFDKYKRLLGTVYKNDCKYNINLELIKQGLAYYYRPRCIDYEKDPNKQGFIKEYVLAENHAKANKLGPIWEDNGRKFIHPCQFKRR